MCPGKESGRRQTRNLMNFVSQFWVRCSCFSKLESGTTGKFQIQDHIGKYEGENQLFLLWSTWWFEKCLEIFGDEESHITWFFHFFLDFPLGTLQCDKMIVLSDSRQLCSEHPTRLSMCWELLAANTAIYLHLCCSLCKPPPKK